LSFKAFYEGEAKDIYPESSLKQTFFGRLKDALDMIDI